MFLAGTLTDTDFKNFLSYLWTHLTHIEPNACYYFISSDFWIPLYTMICLLSYYLIWLRIYVPLLPEILPSSPCPHRWDSGTYHWSPYSLVLPLVPSLLSPPHQKLLESWLPPLYFTYCRHSTVGNSCLLTLAQSRRGESARVHQFLFFSLS